MPLATQHVSASSNEEIGFFLKSRTILTNWWNDEDGTTAVEYAVMLAMIAVACVVAVNLMSSAARDSFQNSAVAIGE